MHKKRHKDSPINKKKGNSTQLDNNNINIAQDRDRPSSPTTLVHPTIHPIRKHQKSNPPKSFILHPPHPDLSPTALSHNSTTPNPKLHPRPRLPHLPLPSPRIHPPNPDSHSPELAQTLVAQVRFIVSA
jgi:hypothetical protein